MKNSFDNGHEHLSPVRAANNRGIFASQGPLFKGAVFGRDSIEVAEDIVEFDSVIPREVLLTLASFQGLKYDAISEEEPGKIHHEYRTLDDVTDERSLEIFKTLSKSWGGNGEFFIYYGSVDSTPLYVRLAGKFIEIYGSDILEETITGSDGNERNFQEHLKLGVDWILHRIQNSDLGFIEYKRTNPFGIANQVWKDSPTGSMHEDGQLLNTQEGVSAIEVQAYAYDALKVASRIFPGSIASETIKKLGTSIVGEFWLRDRNFFASVIDRDNFGAPRQSRVLSSNGGLLLDSEVLVDTPNTETMIEQVRDKLLSSDFLTTAGIRCRSLEYSGLVDYPDYHGSYAVWFKETNDIARGLEKHGYVEEAKNLERIIISTVASLGEYYEFVFVDSDGNISNPSQPEPMFRNIRCNVPEPGQAWTISAWLRSLSMLNS